MLNISLAEIIREELSKPLSESSLYSLSWLYALAQSIGLQNDVLYERMKERAVKLLKDERRYRIDIYDHENAVGILFSLYHIAVREGSEAVPYSNKILGDLKGLRWHEFDGEVMAFSYMLASAVGSRDMVDELWKEIEASLKTWSRDLDHRSMVNIAYTLFGLAYISDERIIKVVKDFELYSPKSHLLRRILISEDIELMALTLYSLGKLAYDRKLKRLKEEHKEEIQSIRLEVIPMITNSYLIPLTEGIASQEILKSPLGESPADIASIPRDLIAKIRLAMIESGLEEPFMLSKHEWEIYQEVIKAREEGYYSVHKLHLTVGLMLNIAIPLVYVFLVLPFLQIMQGSLETAKGILKDLMQSLIYAMYGVPPNLLYGIDLSLITHGYIRKRYMLGVLKHIIDLAVGFPNKVGRG